MLLHNCQAGVRSTVQGSRYCRADPAAVMSACQVWLTDTTTTRHRKTAMIDEITHNSYQESADILQEKNACSHSIRSAAGSRHFSPLKTTKLRRRRCHRVPPSTLAQQASELKTSYTSLGGSRVPLMIRVARDKPDCILRTDACGPSTGVHERRIFDCRSHEAMIKCSEKHSLHHLVGDA